MSSLIFSTFISKPNCLLTKWENVPASWHWWYVAEIYILESMTAQVLPNNLGFNQKPANSVMSLDKQCQKAHEGAELV